MKQEWSVYLSICMMSFMDLQIHGRAGCGTQTSLLQLWPLSGSVSESYHQTKHVQTTFCHPSWPPVAGLKNGQGENWRLQSTCREFMHAYRVISKINYIYYKLIKHRVDLMSVYDNLGVGCTEGCAMWSWRARHSLEAGGGGKACWITPTPVAVFLNDINGVWLKGQTHVDLHYAARPEHRSELSHKKQKTLKDKKKTCGMFQCCRAPEENGTAVSSDCEIQ